MKQEVFIPKSITVNEFLNLLFEYAPVQSYPLDKSKLSSICLIQNENGDKSLLFHDEQYSGDSFYLCITKNPDNSFSYSQFNPIEKENK